MPAQENSEYPFSMDSNSSIAASTSTSLDAATGADITATGVGLDEMSHATSAIMDVQNLDDTASGLGAGQNLGQGGKLGHEQNQDQFGSIQMAVDQDEGDGTKIMDEPRLTVGDELYHSVDVNINVNANINVNQLGEFPVSDDGIEGTNANITVNDHLLHNQNDIVSEVRSNNVRSIVSGCNSYHGAIFFFSFVRCIF